MRSPLNPLPKHCRLRRATATDARAIRWLVLGAFLDPTQLRWQQFWVIERTDVCPAKIVACAQLRQFPEALELGSLVVARSWRRRGLAARLVTHLLAIADKPLYLECLGDNLANFYRQFDFEIVSWPNLPPSLQRKFALSRAANGILGVPVRFMKYDGEPRTAPFALC